MIKKMTGKEMKRYASQMGLRMRDGKATALLSSGKGNRTVAPLKSVDNIPDNAQGWFDPDTKRFDASTKRTTLVAHFVGGSKPEKEKHDIYSGLLKSRKKVKALVGSGCGSDYEPEPSYGCGSSSSSYSGCGSGFSSC